MASCISSALALLGGVIGAGFASGQEIVYFFSRHGNAAWISVVTALLTLMLLFLRLPAQIRRAGCSSLQSLCLSRLGRRLGSLCSALFFLLYAITGGAMLAACAELAALSLNIHGAYALGLAASLLLGAILTGRGLSGIALPGAALCALTPFLFMRLLALPGGEATWLPQGSLPHAAACGALYGALNAAMLAGMFPLLLSLPARAHRLSSCLFTLLFGALLSLGTLVCCRQLSAVRDQPLPFVWLSRSLGRSGYVLVAACMYAAALSTFCAMLSGMTLLLPDALPGRMALCAMLCLFAALLGFGRIVRSAYPVLGLLCSGLLLLLCLPFDLRFSSSKEAGS